ncbi:putative ADP-ribose pyrophosphatase (putative) [Lactiplantibacillus plantarum]|nr:putative ADP-ribose pyrophosphatase (putative) [Lactiplantibacillus plantarum]MCG0811147.1 putative ADP-ribose pyrophosphatase (putative) [Lactiplantibacillus plantarum]MCG0876682.1 putative ADP-ribose pyrophosphatase (putative) [Lactiplantibacillus plantarum]MCG0949039.1 putative ADP-ribose pyrophosphatase (putative) [Lactiplantibacillus plantarum]
METYHRAFGVYGIIGDEHALVVTKKFGGPYTNRYDLPGGSLAMVSPYLPRFAVRFKKKPG